MICENFVFNLAAGKIGASFRSEMKFSLAFCMETERGERKECGKKKEKRKSRLGIGSTNACEQTDRRLGVGFTKRFSRD